MALYDRDYMGSDRSKGTSFGNGFGRGNNGGILGTGAIFGGGALGIIITANLLCFILSAFLERIFGAAFVSQWLALSLGGLAKGAVWEFVSYAFIHEGILHIFLNMLGLYFIGKILQQMIGSGRFVFTYFLGAVFGAAAWLATSFGGRECLVGASAAVMSVFACFCVLYPPVPLTFLIFFILPVRVRPMTILKIAAFLEVFGFLYSLAGGTTSIAYAAHIGGIGAGILSASLFKRGKLSFLNSLSFRTFFSQTGNKKRKNASDYFYKVNIGNQQNGSNVSNDEIDRILEKISSSGFASLTDAERETLRMARGSRK